MEVRAEALIGELETTRQRVSALQAAVSAGEQKLAADILGLDELRSAVAAADDAVSTLRIGADELESAIRMARGEFEAIRATVSEYDLARATAESDLSHLAATCIDAVQATLDEVMVEVEELERTGAAVPDARAILADEADEATDEEGLPVAGEEQPEAQAAVEATAAAVAAASERTLSAEEAISTLRAKIDRLGPVNMMAIEQYDELETRYTFLSTQRKDLVDSIAQTMEAIKRIDETTRAGSSRHSPPSTVTSRRSSRHSSVVAVRGLPSSMKTTPSKAGSRSWRSHPASGCRASNSSLAARRH